MVHAPVPIFHPSTVFVLSQGKDCLGFGTGIGYVIVPMCVTVFLVYRITGHDTNKTKLPGQQGTNSVGKRSILKCKTLVELLYEVFVTEV